MLLYLFANVFLNWKFSRIFSIYHKYHRETIICSWPGGAGWGVAGCGAAQRPFCVLTTLKDMCAQLTGRYRGQTSQSQVYSLVNRSCILCNLSLERESTGNVLPLDLHSRNVFTLQFRMTSFTVFNNFYVPETYIMYFTRCC